MADDRTSDAAWMDLALDLARRGEGLTRPNPPVGAVVVRGDRVVGQGWHRRAGGAHAEVFALRAAGAAARGATLYVTLEPCCTQGRTPPCTEAILAAGVRRVVVAVRDPNPAHSGRGLRRLRAAGVDVAVGVRGAEAGRLIEPFAQWIHRGEPWVVLKLGMTLDGRIADADGVSQWITSPASRAVVQAERHRSDAILVGVGTVAADNPSLLPRPARGRRPWRVVVDPRGRTPPTARLLNDGAAVQTLIAVGPGCDPARAMEFLRRGASVAVVEDQAGGRLSLRALLGHLGGLGILRVLCEGGAELAASLVEARAADELLLFYAPLVLGGRAAAPAFGGAGRRLEDALRFRVMETGRAGPDVIVRARPE
ncbi:MAG: riboflavin biosynthesis protein RibD [Verrucomicrobia bacterium A1]|nr:MAG: riboflavin biosynthesis protein RibD [Verrucomicrobia bacterium A1]